jgi:2-amino-4-hydroxy-6-hydroxymethyldihydropteridine diphosphokinase
MHQVFVGLGSNIDAERNLACAVGRLQRAYGPLRISPVYRSPAVGLTGDEFLNAVVGFETALTPADLRQALRKEERALGRRRPGGSSWHPRTIDLDLLVYGDLCLNEPPLRLPSPDILEYAFVLYPLADLASSWTHPERGQPLEQLRRELELPPAATKLATVTLKVTDT